MQSVVSVHRANVILDRGRRRSRGNVEAQRVSRHRVQDGDGPVQVERLALSVGCCGVRAAI